MGRQPLYGTPEEKLPLLGGIHEPSRTEMARGEIQIDKERCKGCQLCVETCPQKMIRLAEEFNGKGYHFVIFEDSEECTGCTLCGRICPDMAIEVMKE